MSGLSMGHYTPPIKSEFLSSAEGEINFARPGERLINMEICILLLMRIHVGELSGYRLSVLNLCSCSHP